MRRVLILLLLGLMALPVVAQDDGGDERQEEIILQPFNVGVLFNINDGTLADPIGPGRHFYNPFEQTLTVYYTGQQRYETGYREPVIVLTADGIRLSLVTSTTYSVSAETINTLHIRWQDQYDTDFVTPTVRAFVREVVSQSPAANLLASGYSELEAQIEAQLQETFIEEGLILSNFSVDDIIFPEDFVNALEARTLAEVETVQRLTEARGLRDAALIEAEGQAQAALILLEARLNELDRVSEVIAANPLLIQYLLVTTLADDISVFVVPGGDGLDFSLPDPMALPPENRDESGE